jgi:prolyl oligopeptidase
VAHELVPGHHLELALSQELAALPEFRRYGGYTAFTEGWALYAERLGGDLGLYRDPYSRFGQLSYEMWRAIRLVLDTGIHDLGWSREQAIAYFKANSAKSEQEIAAEVDRYVVMPGQALAYKSGELAITSLRAEAERELGTRFDVRDFHAAVLSQGALPLDILERRIRRWITEQQGWN